MNTTKKATPAGATHNQVDNITVEKVLQALKTHRDGITREELVRITKATDRQVRKCIEILRRRSEPIGRAMPKGYTYGNLVDVDRAMADYHAKAISNIEIYRALQNIPLEGQVEL